MCILVALRRALDGGELVIAANRDEKLDRPWQPPHRLADAPAVFGGRDLVAGGSWLAVNLEAAFVVAVPNARLGAPRGERSRGQLVLDLATQRSLPEAVALLGELELARYGPFNLLAADLASAWLATNHPAPGLARAGEEVTVVGNDPLAAPGPRAEFARREAEALAATPWPVLDPALRSLLADHEGSDPICRHGHGYGTVCSSVLRLTPDGLADYRFAPGPPCTTPFSEVAIPKAGARDRRYS